VTAGPGHPTGGPTGAAEPAEDLRGAGPAAATGSSERDSEVVALREQGRSFAGIARALGFERPMQANAAFMAALRRLPAAEQESLRNHELARLNALDERLRQRSDLNETEMARRARSLERLRKRLTA
jgi:hypothetical protein